MIFFFAKNPDKTGKKKHNNTYLLHPNNEETTLSNVQHKYHIH